MKLLNHRTAKEIKYINGLLDSCGLQLKPVYDELTKKMLRTKDEDKKEHYHNILSKLEKSKTALNTAIKLLAETKDL